MTSASLRRWSAVHRWSSLVCTLFLLVLCLTGLPLLFAGELREWLAPHGYAELPADTLMADLDALVRAAQGIRPGWVMASIIVDDDEPRITLWMAPSWAALRSDSKAARFIRFDARTAVVLGRSEDGVRRGGVVLDAVHKLHTEWFLGLPGELALAAMGILFIAAIVSGVVLYGPFTRQAAFATLRTGRGRRLRWLDIHNLFGIATAAWVLVVAATGVMNELASPLFSIWRRTEVPALLRTAPHRPHPLPAELAPVQSAFDTVRAALPGMTVRTILFPSAEFGHPRHYMLWARGDSPLTSRLSTPVLVDAATATISGFVPMPWYLRALELSRPLHFGDYGGLPLKIIWALFDLVTIVVLGSGIYLWFVRRGTPIPIAGEAGRSLP